MDDSLLTRYGRHIMLDDIGIEGQERLATARVLMIGLGGLGAPAALYLAAAGIGELWLCDDDTVELSNLQRQIIYTTDAIGTVKTQAAQQHLRSINPHCRTRAIPQRLSADNADDLIAAVDIVVDGSDNYATRHLVNRACVAHKKPLVFGAAVGFDGQISVFDKNRPDSPCYNCLFSENDDAPDTRCALLGVLAPLVGVVGCVQASEVIKHIAMPQAHSLVGRLLLLDMRDMRWREIGLPRDAQCAICHGE